MGPSPATQKTPGKKATPSGGKLKTLKAIASQTAAAESAENNTSSSGKKKKSPASAAVRGANVLGGSSNAE